jgi:hypothetical protein
VDAKMDARILDDLPNIPLTEFKPAPVTYFALPPKPIEADRNLGVMLMWAMESFYGLNPQQVEYMKKSLGRAYEKEFRQVEKIGKRKGVVYKFPRISPRIVDVVLHEIIRGQNTGLDEAIVRMKANEGLNYLGVAAAMRLKKDWYDPSLENVGLRLHGMQFYALQGQLGIDKTYKERKTLIQLLM